MAGEYTLKNYSSNKVGLYGFIKAFNINRILLLHRRFFAVKKGTIKRKEMVLLRVFDWKVLWGTKNGSSITLPWRIVYKYLLTIRLQLHVFLESNLSLWFKCVFRQHIYLNLVLMTQNTVTFLSLQLLLEIMTCKICKKCNVLFHFIKKNIIICDLLYLIYNYITIICNFGIKNVICNF